MELTHIDKQNMPTMVDVSLKDITVRTAHAHSEITLTKEVIKLFDGKDIVSKKGPVFQTAIIAGTTAAKKTSDIIPFCHPINVESIKIDVSLTNDTCKIDCIVKCSGKTGVEMEALTGAQVTALTIYDMCKAMGHGMTISNGYLIEKTGGKSDVKR